MIQILLIAVLSLLAQLIFPWWSLTIVAFLICFWRSSSAGQAFLYGSLGTASVWLIYTIITHSRTDGIFTSRMGLLLFKTGGAVIPILVAVLLCGLVGGLAGLSGFLTRQATGSQIANRKAERPR